MLLLTDSLMQLHHASMKYFVPGEVHVTRICPYSVLILMIDGTLRFREDKTEISVTPGEYYIQRAGLLQEGVPMQGRTPVYFYVEFYGGSYAETGSGLSILGQYQLKNIQPVISAYSLACSRRTANRFLLNSYMFRIFSELTQNSPAYSNKTELLSMVRRYLHSEYASPITLGTLARQFGYQPDYLSRMFRKQYRISLYQYLITVRMEHALWLLRNTDIKISEIASAVGYHDLSSFYRAFEKCCGAPPHTFR